MKNKLIVVALYLLAALLYIIGPNSIFKVCQVGASPMKCHWSVLAEIGIAILLIGIAIIYIAAKSVREKVLISIVSIVNSIVAILIPSVLIRGCTMRTMACQTKTFPAFYVIAIIMILASGTNILYLSQKHKGKS